MDELRLERLKYFMEKFQELCMKMYAELKKSSEELGAATSGIDGHADVQAWIAENRTDKVPSAPVEYVPYKQQYSHPSSSIASAPGSSSSARPVSQGSVASTPAVTAPIQTVKPQAQASKQTAIAQFDFAASDDTELSFHAGDVITVTKIDDSGWWEGSLNGKEGMFPGNYVELNEGGKAAARAPAAPQQRKCRVQYEFVAQGPDELTIHVGEVITIDAENEAWFTGTNARGQTGMFPANYVTEL